jgi:acetyltransferase-like isoleucine patch superfamily enzyme
MYKIERCQMISETAIVKATRIGKDVQIREYAIVREDVEIGDGVVIHPHVVIEPGVTIGNRVEIFPGAYIGKEPKGAGAMSRSPCFERYVNIGDDCSIGPNAIIFYDVEIGPNTLLGNGASIREKCRIGSRCIIASYVTVNYNTAVGDRTKIMDLTHITGNCRIGSDVFVSVSVGTTNDNSMDRLPFDPTKIHGPIIEDGAALGAGATLIANVRIGKGSIVGAGAVVTRDLPENVLAMGIPARAVRTLEKS